MSGGAGGWGGGDGLPPWQGGGPSNFGPPPGGSPGGFGSPPGGFGPPPGTPPGGFGPPAGGPPGGYKDPVPGEAYRDRLGAGPSGDWSPTEAMAFGWERVKTDPVGVLMPLIVGGMIGNSLSILGNIIQQMAPKSQSVQIVTGVLSILSLLVTTYMNGGMLYFVLRVARGEKAEFGDIFKGAPYFLSLLGSSVLIGLAVPLGLLLFVYPGVYLALAWSLTSYLIVDREMGAIDSMRESWGMTEGHKLNIFVLGLLIMAMMIGVGIFTCCMGLIVAGPIAQLAVAYAYLKISGQETA